ncbi:MAG TPA: secondary thiamine-phosphate synthase enzyme YjbQ [Candidatus Pygmaiobacter gallistercoris]|nr:secondary thiamine-phosphate synthase enzyme YjbQ [Candidatus Pygmaiobacter gallistercoris]
MVKLNKFVLQTMKETQYILITDRVEKLVEQSGIQNGVVFVITAHTTSGITVNESLECLQSDMEVLMDELAPELKPYSHARMLHSYGQTAGNAPGHLKAMLTNNHAVLPVQNGKIVRGHAAEIFFAEYDGPQDRTVLVEVMGE